MDVGVSKTQVGVRPPRKHLTACKPKLWSRKQCVSLLRKQPIRHKELLGLLEHAHSVYSYRIWSWVLMPVGRLGRQSLAESTMLAPSSGGLAVIVAKASWFQYVSMQVIGCTQQYHNTDLPYTYHSQYEYCIQLIHVDPVFISSTILSSWDPARCISRRLGCHTRH